MTTYKDKIDFINGGGSGIGRSLALLDASSGAKVCVAGIHLESEKKYQRNFQVGQCRFGRAS
jgi:NADP-dependent 3-hydroxy acid dehydrogenase YdfG